MAENIYIPRLGQTMEEGTIQKWLKNEGDHINKGEDVYTLEYDKAVVNVESTADGILQILLAEGETAPVGTVVGLVLADGENMK